MSSKISTHSTIEMNFSITLSLTPEEAEALKQITIYGPDRFIDWFYKNLGKEYLKPHEDALISLFNKIKTDLPHELKKVQKMKQAVVNAAHYLDQNDVVNLSSTK